MPIRERARRAARARGSRSGRAAAASPRRTRRARPGSRTDRAAPSRPAPRRSSSTPAAGIDRARHDRDVVAPRLHGHAETLRRGPRGTFTFRNVRAGSGCPQQGSTTWPRRPAPPGPKSYSVAPPERHRHAPGCPAARLQRARHRPRVRHVVPDVVALVDARDDDVGRAAQDVRDGQVHAVGRRAVHREDAFPERSIRSGRRSVSAWPMALASRCGATMVTAPSLETARASSCRPADRTPSSLVTRIRFMLDERRDPGAATPSAGATGRARRGVRV
jgi:hypothetical protein